MLTGSYATVSVTHYSSRLRRGVQIRLLNQRGVGLSEVVLVAMRADPLPPSNCLPRVIRVSLFGDQPIR